jgi:SAM-dependent methyltransferase
MARKKSAGKQRPTFLNAGCGAQEDARLPALFAAWKQIRVDVDPRMKPDIVASIADLSEIGDESVDAIWSAHCLEHLFAHEVPISLSEFRRVLRDDGFLCIIVPDLQAIAEWIATDRLDKTIYESGAGPVTASDMIWGFGPAIARGIGAMAHHCGFTPTPLIRCISEAGFPELLVRRKQNLELAAVALRRPSEIPGYRESLMEKLGL